MTALNSKLEITVEISFDVSAKDARLIDIIIDRVEALAQADGLPFDRLSRSMDLMACQANGLNLDLKAMAEWDRDLDLVHDVFGIQRHLDREKVAFKDCFSPRFILRKEVA